MPRIAIAIVALAAFTGCGSSGNSAASADFAARANAVCHAAQLTGRSLRAPQTQAELAPFFDRALALGREETGRLRALRPPSDRAAAFRAWVGGLEHAVTLLARADAAAHAGRVGEVQTIIREGSALTQSNLANARAVGLAMCAKEG